MPHKGVDLSHWNDPVDFGTLKAGGTEFAALKATDGAHYVDPTFHDRQARARAVGFRRLGFYHFLRPLDDAQAQATLFARTVGALRSGEFVALDVEACPGWDGLSAEESAHAVIATVYYLKRLLGIPASSVFLYGSHGARSGASWLRDRFGDHLQDLAFTELWAACYGPLGDVSPWKAATIQQTGDRGTVQGAGAAGTVDTDLWLDEGAW